MHQYRKMWNLYKKKEDIVPGTEFLLIPEKFNVLGFTSSKSNLEEGELPVGIALKIAEILKEEIKTKEQLDDFMGRKYEVMFRLGMEFLELTDHTGHIEEFRKIAAIPRLNPNVQHPVTGWAAVHAIAHHGNWEQMKVLARTGRVNFLIPNKEGELGSHIAIRRKQDKRMIRFLRAKERQQARQSGQDYSHLSL